MGTLITFYSYKGGVGRTMALANVATLLAMWGRRVLVVDWDLEAPGIEHFLLPESEIPSIQDRSGLIELLTALSQKPAESPDWKSFLSEITVVDTSAKLTLLTAGARTDRYFKTVRSLDVKSFYEEKEGGQIVESLRNKWKAEFDFVLVDSRTGITDIGGICTIQLPDILALVFTATSQSLGGAVDVAKRASVQRQHLPFDRPLVPTIPIPSRFDTQTEHRRSQDWLGKFEEATKPFYHQWLPRGVSVRDFLQVTKIPYTAYFSFGECLPVVVEGSKDPTGLAYAFETLAALIGNNLEYADLLLSNRDEFVQKARFPSRIPKIALRETQWCCVLFINISVDAPTNPQEEREAASSPLKQVHELVQAGAREYRGDLIESDGQNFVFAFRQPEEALNCALRIQEDLAVKSPVSGASGPFSARMAVHVVAPKQDPIDRTAALRKSAALIARNARDGEVLVSEQVKLKIDSLLNVHFEPQGEIDLTSAPDGHTSLFRADRIVTVHLNEDEYAALQGQDPETRGGGGFQALLVGLQERVTQDRRLDLNLTDRERIARYAHDYKSGGWQGRLRRIFGRTLGHNLGRA